MTARPTLPSPAELTLLTDEKFAACWRDLVGELPAAMLPDRAEMIQLLVRSVAPAEPEPEGDEAADGWADLFGRECGEAGRHIAGLGTVRECRGEG